MSSFQSELSLDTIEKEARESLASNTDQPRCWGHEAPYGDHRGFNHPVHSYESRYDITISGEELLIRPEDENWTDRVSQYCFQSCDLLHYREMSQLYPSQSTGHMRNERGQMTKKPIFRKTLSVSGSHHGRSLSRNLIVSPPALREPPIPAMNGG